MGSKVVVIDTSVLCCFLNIHGKETAGSATDQWNHARAVRQIDAYKSTGATLVLPLATIIETGNHISQCNGSRFDLAKALCELITESAESRSPWAPFYDQVQLWTPDRLSQFAIQWPELAAQKTSIGDYTIKDVADYYSAAGYHVEILTADANLKSRQPAPPPDVPRRRSKTSVERR